MTKFINYLFDYYIVCRAASIKASGSAKNISLQLTPYNLEGA